ncbi:MAG: hypothetical protein U5L09_06965 [Bacteroidales bacterium]|nr:hypothetical protein [Bacteroidales bacterium]
MPTKSICLQAISIKTDTFEFFFDIGLSPDVELNLEEKTFDFYRIKVDDKQLEEYITNIKNQYGEQQSVDDEVKEKDIVKGTLTELDDNGEAKLMVSSTKMLR